MANGDNSRIAGVMGEGALELTLEQRRRRR
jgi:hypothetical protein